MWKSAERIDGVDMTCVDLPQKIISNSLRVHHLLPSHPHSPQIPGSYLCRMQDGDLKYRVAFSSPTVRDLKVCVGGVIILT